MHEGAKNDGTLKAAVAAWNEEGQAASQSQTIVSSDE